MVEAGHLHRPVGGFPSLLRRYFFAEDQPGNSRFDSCSVRDMKPRARTIASLKPGTVFSVRIEGELHTLRLAFFIGKPPEKKRGKLVNPSAKDDRYAYCRRMEMDSWEGKLVDSPEKNFVKLSATTGIEMEEP